MFKDLEKNFTIVEGAYKKVKSLYFYSKDKLFERLKISTFESDNQLMHDTFYRIAEYLQNPIKDANVTYIKDLINRIDYKVFPKKFKEKETDNNTITSEIKEKDLTNVNFLIDMPIELMLLDCIWTLLVGKIAYDNQSVSTSNFANQFQSTKIFKDGIDLVESIDFCSNRLFKPYFKQYTYWRNYAIECIENEYTKGNDTALISLDLKGYFYSVDFNFKNLERLLNNDTRLKDIAFLTKIIKDIYIYYTDILSNIRKGITAKTKNEDVIFPFQMCSSCFLANLYLSDLDYKIEMMQDVIYYGRYVDDIIIIFKNSRQLKKQDSIIKELLIDTQIIEDQENRTYGIYDTNVKINSEKIKVFSFFAKDPRTLIDFLKEHMFVRVSSVDFFAAELDNEPFENKVYYLQNSQGYSKFKDLSILQSDNYNAVNYIYKLINLNKNVAERYDKYNNHILDFYRGSACLEFRSSWVLILYLGVIQQNEEFIKDFYNMVKSKIEDLSKKELQDVSTKKKDIIIERVKESLCEEFDVAVAIALSLNSRMNITKEKIADYTSKIKRANMFNHYLVSYPLLNYTYEASDIDFSLIETNLENVVKNGLKIDWNKIKYSPRFIHLEEINLFNFIARYYRGGNIFINTIGENFQRFEEINNIKSEYPIIDKYDDEDKIETIEYKLLGYHNDVHIGVASLPLSEDDCTKSIIEPNWALTVNNKIRLFGLLKEAVDNDAHFLVFPECYLPVAWVGEVANFAKRYNITIVAGLQYIVYKDRVYNYIANIQPFYSDTVHYRNVFMHIREKYDYSPIEKEQFAQIHKNVVDSKSDILTIYDLAGQFRYCNRVCYELTNIKIRAKMRGKVELIIAPEFNKDTNYFSNIIETTARDNSCFIAQANTSIYGDSRITGPYSTVEKNIISVKGGKNDIVLVDAVDINKLIEFRDKIDNGYSCDAANKKINAMPRFKTPSARFFDDKNI